MVYVYFIEESLPESNTSVIFIHFNVKIKHKLFVPHMMVKWIDLRGF